MRTEIDMRSMVHLNQAISHYINHLSMLVFGYRPEHSMTAWKEKKGLKQDRGFEMRWLSPDVHHIIQTWSNTSGMWEGIGGSALTSEYTTVFVNQDLGFIAVYYCGEFMYMAEIDLSMRAALGDPENWSRLPGINSCSKKLTVIHKRERNE